MWYHLHYLSIVVPFKEVCGLQEGWCGRGTCYGNKFSLGYLSNSVPVRKLIVGRFDCEGLHQLQNSFVADEDLHGRNVLLLTSLPLHELLRYPRENPGGFFRQRVSPVPVTNGLERTLQCCHDVCMYISLLSIFCCPRRVLPLVCVV